MGCEAINIMNEEICAYKTEECICSIKCCFCNIKKEVCITKEKDNSLISKDSAQKSLKNIKDSLTMSPTYSDSRERRKRELLESEMVAEIHRKIF